MARVQGSHSLISPVMVFNRQMVVGPLVSSYGATSRAANTVAPMIEAPTIMACGVVTYLASDFTCWHPRKALHNQVCS